MEGVSSFFVLCRVQYGALPVAGFLRGAAPGPSPLFGKSGAKTLTKKEANIPAIFGVQGRGLRVCGGDRRE